MNKREFNVQLFYNKLLIIKNEANHNMNNIMINYIINKLNLLFTNEFKGMPNEIIDMLYNQYYSYGITYIPVYHINNKETGIRQDDQLTYFKNITHDNVHFNELTSFDVINIINNLDYNLYKWAEKEGISLYHRKYKISTNLTKFIMCLTRNKKLITNSFYLIIQILLILFILIISTNVGCQISQSRSLNKLSHLTVYSEYTMIKHNKKYKKYYKKKISSNKNKLVYNKNFKAFKSSYFVLKHSKRTKLENHLPKMVQSSIMMETVKYDFHNVIDFSIVAIICITIFCGYEDRRILSMENFSCKVGKVVSIETISSIGIYSIIMNFVEKALVEPSFISKSIILILYIMAFAFEMYALCEELCDKNYR